MEDNLSQTNKFGMKPVRIGIAGLSHDHVIWLLKRPDRGDIEIVGIYEPDQALAERYAGRYNFDPKLIFNTLGGMLETAKPEAAVAFGSIYEHLATVEACAPRGIHVMVEKPLAVSLEHALAMEALAQQHGIYLLTNYETTWYASHYAAYELVHEQRLIGDIRKVVVHDGHWGPKEIGCTAEFLAWLTDPILNGGGALIDFGCYGPNLVTWLMQGEPPLSVTAVTQQLKPDIYPKVDDEATIILTYPQAQAIIQASWNWPFNRKDMEIYGQTGYVQAVDGRTLCIRASREKEEQVVALEPRPAPGDDPFAYLAAVIRGEIELAEGDLSSLSNNILVMRILEAARQSVKTGKSVLLEPA
jgi:predicted dehydrogenase